MPSLKLAFLVVAIVLCAVAAFPVPTGRVGIGWLGIAFGFAAQVVP